MSGVPKGFLEVGTNRQFEVVVNHPDLKPDANGVGHIVFSTSQARAFARLLLLKADDADRERIEAEAIAVAALAEEQDLNSDKDEEDE